MNPPNLKEILLAGFQRFYGEGYFQWSKENVEKAIQPRNISNSFKDTEIQKMLSELESEGYIKLILSDAIYLEVLEKSQEAFR